MSRRAANDPNRGVANAYPTPRGLKYGSSVCGLHEYYRVANAHPTLRELKRIKGVNVRLIDCQSRKGTSHIKGTEIGQARNDEIPSSQLFYRCGSLSIASECEYIVSVHSRMYPTARS